MSHVVVIIQRQQPYSDVQQDTELSYSYSIPIPHGTKPHEVAEIVGKAYRRLEGADDE